MVDVDGDGRDEVAMGGGVDYLDVVTFAASASGSTLWRVETTPGAHLGHLPAIADVNGDGELELGTLLADGTFECRKAATGELVWSHPLGASGSSVISVDVDKDGLPEFVVGTTDGRVVCMTDRGAAPRELWTVSIGHNLGDVVAADVDGDGHSELVVTADNGYLYVPRS